METNATGKSLRQLRNEKPAKRDWFHRYCPWLLDWKSLFYYGLFLLALGFAWAAYALYRENMSQLLNWDYTWQYIPFTYDYWDAWHTFFTTGHFPLYDPQVYVGTDMIGSGSYYGLFDPFMFICYLLPRDWIPQTYALMTFVKLAVGGLFMRAYLRKMGIQEFSSRLGGVIYAFSGFTCFFEGSPNFTSAMAFFPLILLGIEQVIREQRMTALILGVAFVGVSCFFYIPITCIFGVIYALWRFFTTVKQRNRRQTILTMVYGVAGFAIGLMMCAFTFLPSLRETSTTGRSTSIGTAYMHVVLDSLKNLDFRMLFSFIFEEVGDNPGRELMGVISFFFPTGGWTNLPLARMVNGSGNIGYDAWTSSLFCYTPCVILFFAAILHSIRLKKWSHLLAIVLCSYAVLTTFSYYFFYAFSGNGYGRWYLVLVPLIVYYCCWAFDQRKTGPRVVPFIASALALIGTIATFYLTIAILKDKTFTSSVYNINGNPGYWPTKYATAYEEYGSVVTAWFFYYQLGFVLVEGAILCIGYRKQWIRFALLGLVTAEVIVMGNVAYAFNGTWSYQNSYAGGADNREVSLKMMNAINENDKTLFRVQSDTFEGSNYYHFVFGANTTSVFHSLMNFDVETFALNNHMKTRGSYPFMSYDRDEIYNPSWSGYYGNKRYVLDTLLGMRYYIVKNNYSSWSDPSGEPYFLSPNVPFGAEEMVDYSPNRNLYRVYRRGEDSMPLLGYAVSNDDLYYMGAQEDSRWNNGWNDVRYESSGTAQHRIQSWLEHVELTGAIIDDDVTLPESFTVKQAPELPSTDSLFTEYTGKVLYGLDNWRLKLTSYVTEEGDNLFASKKKDYYNEGVGYFLNHYETKSEIGFARYSGAVIRDREKLVYSPVTGQYFNSDPDGCYIQFQYYNGNSDIEAPRIYAIGDRYNEQGELEENVCLAFEANSVQALRRAGHDGTGEHSMNNFGLYCHGLVKHVVLCYGGGKEITSVPYRGFFFTVHEKYEIDEQEATMRANALKNVTYGVNEYQFDTSLTEDRVVVTQLGYDAGWGVTATLPDGKKVDCQMLRLDGGLVGFVAPSVLNDQGQPRTIHYSMRYKTPYSTLGVGLWVIGVVLYCGYLGYSVVSEVKNKKKATKLA